MGGDGGGDGNGASGAACPRTVAVAVAVPSVVACVGDSCGKVREELEECVGTRVRFISGAKEHGWHTAGLGEVVSSVMSAGANARLARIDAVVMCYQPGNSSVEALFKLSEALKKHKDRVFLCVVGSLEAAVKRAASCPTLQALLVQFAGRRTLQTSRPRDSAKVVVQDVSSLRDVPPFDWRVLCSADYCKGADARGRAKSALLWEMFHDPAQRRTLDSRFAHVLSSATSGHHPKAPSSPGSSLLTPCGSF